jgi:transglutaminase-like putative cysteine protease
MLWRMQPLDAFDGVTWRAARGSPPLPQPAAVRMQIAVHVRGLRGDLAVSPGRIESIEGAAAARPVDDEAWSLAPQPGPGATYRVSARAVNVDANRLWRAPAPDDLRLLDYTRVRGRPATIALGPLSVPIRPPRPIDIATPLWGWPASEDARAAAAATPYARVAALARRLAAGAHTQYGVVQRVQRYLLSSRFRYTTDVVKPGRFPLADFLLRTHAGYCQHFAGAAALLLRLAGVPTRMVAGFATGIAHSGRYDVRDVDAHDWIEVYFQGVGWVPFNPTPAADPASVSGAFAAGAGRRGGEGPPVAIAVLALAALAAAACVPGRRDPAERLARLLGAGPDATLADIRAELARSVGPHTAALAAELERRRFAPAGAPRRRTSSLARALARDAGPTRPWRAARLLIRSAR